MAAMLLATALLVPGIYCVAYAIAAELMFPRWRRVLLGVGGLLFICAAFEFRPPLPPGHVPPDLENCWDARGNQC